MRSAHWPGALSVVELLLSEGATLKRPVRGIERLEERRLLSFNAPHLPAEPLMNPAADHGAAPLFSESSTRDDARDGPFSAPARGDMFRESDSARTPPETVARQIEGFLAALRGTRCTTDADTLAGAAQYDYDHDADIDFDDIDALLDLLGVEQTGGSGTASDAMDPLAFPYSPSLVIDAIDFDFASHDRQAPGSDNWPITWADDGHQYAAWGDGGGFGGTNSDGRSSLGIARIEGPAGDYEGVNVWGGKGGENPAQFNGKSYGILSVDGDLYMWVSPGSGTASFGEARLAVSHDRGATWALADWAFTQSDAVILPTFLQFGRDYDGARDEFVYSYAARLHDASGLNIQFPGQIDLMRAASDQILTESAWEFFAGVTADGQPVWTSDINARQPVFEDPNGVGWTVSASYNQGLGRYFLATEHTRSARGNLGVFDAPEPWGPWSTSGYYGDWGSFGRTFFWNFSNKWLSEDGRDFTVLFTGKDENDSWNAVPGSFLLTVPTPGDMDFDGLITFDDINGFVLAIERPAVYAATYGVSGALHGDHDEDRDLDFDDIDGFVASLGVSAHSGVFSLGAR